MIAKLLHEGETTTQLKNVIRYNTVDKEYLNSIDNPRLLQAISNLGIIDISEPTEYQYFMREFICEINLNKSISTNKRQKKLYAHEVISFEDEDNKNHTQDELIKIAIETLNNLYDMDNTPYVLWPQIDSGHLHFHIVRSAYDNQGIYQRVKNSKLKMRQSCEKIELKYKLTLTGNNVSDEIRQSNDPMLKVFKNRTLEAEYHHQKNISEAIKQDSPLGNIKRKTYDLLMNDTYQNKAELAEQQAYQAKQQIIDEKIQINSELEIAKSMIFTTYKNAKDETDFIEQIEKQGIAIELLKHSKTGTNKGIVFHHQGQSISGGKISSSMTLGKIKKRFSNFIHTLEKPPSLRATFKQQRKMLDFQIESINRYYKQQKNNINGDILIYFGKKNIVARPYNYNIVLSSNRDSIKFGSSTNSYDLTLSINVALENGWTGATLNNSSPEFLIRMMKAAYDKDPKLLFFVQPDTPNQLSYADLKEIKSQLTIDELKTALINQLISQNDIATAHQDLIKQLELDKNNHANLGYANALKSGFILNDLKKKTPEELKQFYHHKTFQPLSQKTIDTTRNPANLTNNIDGRAECLEELKAETEINLKDIPKKDLDEVKQHRHHLKHN